MSDITGPAGHAVKLGIDSDPKFAETVCHWLLTAPGQSPAWNQYNVAVVRLRDGIPGMPPPIRQFPGATHEVLILALDPTPGPQTVETMAGHAERGDLPFLTPVNLAHQIEGSDAEAEELAYLAVRAICDGLMAAEPPLGAESFRAGWKQTLVKTLAHIRGEEHAP